MKVLSIEEEDRMSHINSSGRDTDIAVLSAHENHPTRQKPGLGVPFANNKPFVGNTLTGCALVFVITNFTDSWLNEYAFATLIHRPVAEVIEYKTTIIKVNEN